MLIHAVVEIDDDEIVDNRLPATISFLASKNGEFGKQELEGYIEPYIPIDYDKFDMSMENANDNPIMIIRFDDSLTYEELEIFKDTVKLTHPNITPLFIHKDMDVLCSNREQALELLNSMITKIQILGK